MAKRALSQVEREWLDYMRDIGFDELYLQDSSSQRVAVPQPSQERSVKATPAASEASRDEMPLDTPRETETQTVGAEAPQPPKASESTTEKSRAGDSADLAPVDLAGLDLQGLGALVGGCTACRLSEGRHSVVFGSGNPNADLMFIGEGPGAEEDRQGLPFVGPAGNLLTKIISAIELEREEVYIANVVKCRPPRNRDPEPDEVVACRGYLERQIELVRPRVIVALGRVAAQTLLGLDSPLGRMRGSWHEVLSVPTRVTYHPAALLRNSGYRRPTWEDMQIVRDRLAEGA